jgi:hypothetical protein
MHKKSQVKKIFREFSRIFMVQHQNLFQDSNIPKSYLAQIRGFSLHNNEIKMIRRGYYSSNNFQDSNKRKRTESKTMGYLPRVFFFNAFELGAESANHVISNEVLRSIAEVFSTMNRIVFKKISRTNSIKILFQSIMNSYKFTRYWYFEIFWLYQQPLHASQAY